jgi:hypothetical protein
MWKPYFSLSFLDKKISHAFYHGSGSAAGLLFVDMQFCQKRSVWNDLIVCNPLTGRSVMLPVPSSMRAPSSMAVVLAKGIVAGEYDGNRQTYKVVAVCQVPGGAQGALYTLNVH